ncbi:MAG: DJ-1/PfpI family protein, partial [Halobaculum sp.]
PDGTLADPGSDDAPDLLVVPGGGWNDRSMAGAWAEYQRGAIPDAVAAHHDAGATVASVCTGGMLLAKAGVLDGRPAVTHASALEDLRETEADVREERVVDDGSVVTAGGVTSGIDLALVLVERFAGSAVAEQVSETMEYERRTEPFAR